VISPSADCGDSFRAWDDSRSRNGNWDVPIGSRIISELAVAVIAPAVCIICGFICYRASVISPSANCGDSFPAWDDSRSRNGNWDVATGSRIISELAEQVITPAVCIICDFICYRASVKCPSANCGDSFPAWDDSRSRNGNWDVIGIRTISELAEVVFAPAVCIICDFICYRASV
jgi:predicted Zn-ribbon and HTH transcriptional regulator